MVVRGSAARSRADDAEDVLLLHNEVLHAVELDLAAGVLAEKDPVAFLHREREILAVVVDLAGAHGNDLAFLRLLLGGVGDDEPAVLLVLLLEALDEHAVMERAQRRLLPLSRFHCLGLRRSPSLPRREHLNNTPLPNLSNGLFFAYRETLRSRLN